MTDRYVGPGGNDGSDGLSWANRKLTLNGAEDTPVVAGDDIYVGPGVYRETLIIDVTGTSGNPITYIGDVSGENTDSVGGVVRITGSDNDQSATRSDAIQAETTEDYRTFRGFSLDTCTAAIFDLNDVDNWIIEDCYIAQSGQDGVNISGVNQANNIIRRCVFAGFDNQGVDFNHSATVADASSLVENCIFVGGNAEAIICTRVGGITAKNCLFFGVGTGLRVNIALAGGSTVDVNNCILFDCALGLRGTVTGEVDEDFNSFYENNTDRTDVVTGANSNTFPPTFTPPLLLDGLVFPWTPFQLSEWSQIGRIAGTGEATDDLLGVVRPTVSAKKSWGALQLREAERETGTVQTGSAALTLADAGDHQIYVPVTATSTTFKVAARYESEYAGTLPRLIVRQPGQADQVDTMVAAADTWEDLSLTFAPAAVPPYVVIILRSLNTSVTGDFDTYWDDLDVS